MNSKTGRDKSLIMETYLKNTAFYLSEQEAAFSLAITNHS